MICPHCFKVVRVTDILPGGGVAERLIAVPRAGLAELAEAAGSEVSAVEGLLFAADCMMPPMAGLKVLVVITNLHVQQDGVVFDTGDDWNDEPPDISDLGGRRSLL